MALWREPVPRTITEGQFTSERRTLVQLHGPRHPSGPFEVFYRRWTGSEDLPPFGPHTAREPEQVVEYRVPGRPVFTTLEEARECAKAWARRIPDFEREQYEAQIPAPRPVRVNELPGLDPSLKAWIMLHLDGRFEVRCFHHEVVAAAEDGSHQEWDWVRIRSVIAVFATDLQEAEAAAWEELADQAQSTGK